MPGSAGARLAAEGPAGGAGAARVTGATAVDTRPRVVIFTDQPVLAEGLRELLESSTRLEFGGMSHGAEEFLRLLRQARPALALLDSEAVPGLEFLRQARSAWSGCQFALWTSGITIDIVRRAFGFGMSGVISGKTGPEALAAALIRIARGELYFPDVYCTPGELAGTAMSMREKELTSLIAQGLKNKEIATAMHLSEGTVKAYLNRLYRRLGVKDRFELALFGLQAFFGNWGKTMAEAPVSSRPPIYAPPAGAGRFARR